MSPRSKWFEDSTPEQVFEVTPEQVFGVSPVEQVFAVTLEHEQVLQSHQR